MNILETIVEKKKIEVASKKQMAGIDLLISMNKNFDRPCLSLKRKLQQGDANIIAEFKRKSPSKGFMNEHIPIADVVPAYEKFGAAAVSVLTDNEFFGGDIEELKTARNLVNIPLLRKDFMIDEYQLYEAKRYGADLILLIAACLSKKQVQYLAAKAKELQLEVLLELHTKAETEYICDEVDIIGINNRNLETFVTDVKTSLDLIDFLPTNKPVISESGIADTDVIIELYNAGFKGFLIGEIFMKAHQPAVVFADFMQNLKSSINGNENKK
ncbi:MAG: indole-3-glycerol phosphate synthase TrpC [Bacteroidetes bacterium]|nr:indole-3-glycerol phosphate synthase TrpC [Bacteroidota bacterium]